VAGTAGGGFDEEGREREERGQGRAGAITGDGIGAVSDPCRRRFR
jgi:hypothetical protein